MSKPNKSVSKKGLRAKRDLKTHQWVMWDGFIVSSKREAWLYQQDPEKYKAALKKAEGEFRGGELTDEQLGQMSGVLNAPES